MLFTELGRFWDPVLSGIVITVSAVVGIVALMFVLMSCCAFVTEYTTGYKRKESKVERRRSDC